MIGRLRVTAKERSDDDTDSNSVCTEKEVGLRLVERDERTEGDGEESLDTSVENTRQKEETVAAAPPGDEHTYSRPNKQESIMSWKAGQPKEFTTCYGSEIPSV